jgi:O-6-methylguanine DNA methyltransferase
LGYIERSSLEILSKSPQESEKGIERIQSLKNGIKNYGEGKKVNLVQKAKSLNLLNINTLFSTEFSRKVIQYLIHNVDYGETVTYSDIGANINSKAYQAIGTVLRKNPLPLIIPCHRVIRKDGSTGGYMGKKPQTNGWETNLKRELLNLEKSY